jgi:outer membrane lipoprotein-sorting protein
MKATISALTRFPLICLLILVMGNALHAQTATEIVQKATQQFHGNTNHAVVTMKIIRPEWTREVSIKSWAKGADLGLVLITAPARDQGTVFLKRGKEVWNWVPSIERLVKLPPSMMSQGWMGSDFSNDDLVKESSQINDFTHTLAGTESINGTYCYKVVMVPKPDAPVVWGKVIAWISKDHFLQLKSEFYDEDGELVNTLTASSVKMMGGRMIPTHVEMVPADSPGQKTVMDYSLISYDQPIDDAFFSIQNAKNVR